MANTIKKESELDPVKAVQYLRGGGWMLCGDYDNNWA